MAKKYEISMRAIGKTLKAQGIRYYKREKVQKSTKSQSRRQKTRYRKLRWFVEANIECDIIVDDESYLSLCGENMPGNAGYYTKSKDACPYEVRFIGKKKNATKVMSEGENG